MSMMTASANGQGLGGFAICPVCETTIDGFAAGPGGRPHARCPSCHSLERHRALALVLRRVLHPAAAGAIAVEVAPSEIFRARIADLGYTYVGMDFDPAADGRVVNVQASLTDVPLRTGSVDIALVYHVLEHIPDDSAAVGEIARILGETGIAFVQVPWRPDQPTDEDLTVTDPEVRTARFGQADHVRYYGTDFEDRLSKGGLAFERFLTGEVFSEQVIVSCRLVATEPIWLCAGNPDVVRRYADELRSWKPNDLVEVLESTLASVISDRDESVSRQTATAEKSRQQAAELEVLRRKARDLTLKGRVRRIARGAKRRLKRAS